MEITEVSFDILCKFIYNENWKDSEHVYYGDKPLYRALVFNNQLRASGPLTNGHLPLSEDEDMRYYTAPSSFLNETVHNEIKKFLRK